jgi:ankyrin repeat protein
MCAAEGAAREVFNLLLERGSLLGARDGKGLTLLHHAICSEDPDFVESLILLELVSIKEADLCKEPLIHHTLFSLGDRAEKMVEVLLRHGANPLAVSTEGETALHQAAMLKGDALFNRLRAFGGDPFAPNKKGIKPIHCALIAGNMRVFEQLCTSSVEFYQLTPCGKSLMFFAMWSGKKKSVARVLELEKELRGKIVPPFDMLTQRDHENLLPSAYAFKKAAWEDGQDFILFLLKLGRTFTLSRAEFGDYVSLFAVARHDIRRVMLDTIYSNSEFIDQPLCHGEPLLRWAVKEGDLALAEYAIQRGAKVNPGVTRESPTTPLHDAVEENKPDMVLLLLQRGADSYAQNRQGLSPLSLAIEKLAKGEALDFSIVESLIQFRVSSLRSEQHRVFLPSLGFA